MKPILFSSTETNFTTQGIGKLDCASCIVTEERNGIFEVEMRIATSALHYDQCVEGNILYVIHDDTKTPQPFQIYKRTKPINGVSVVYAEHISYRLGMIVTMPFSATNITDALSRLKGNAVEGCPFDFMTDKNSVGSFIVETPCSIRSKLGGEAGSVLDAFGGGEYKWDHFTVRLYQHRGSDTGVTLRRGKNITDYTKNTTLEGVYTAIVPYFRDAEGIVTLPEQFIRLSGAAAGRTVSVDLSDKFDSRPTVDQLRAAAYTYLQSNAKNYVSENAKVSFVALWQTEEYKTIAPLQRVKLCDTVTIVYDDRDSAKAKVIKTVYNVLLERYDEIELGEATSNMNTAIKQITDFATENDVTSSAMQKAIDHATKLITGGLGGFVVFNLNANGQPQEILIMDTDNKETAVNVIRMNKNGIAFSRTGYNGPFNTAWTIDSTFYADFITAGTFNASLIQTGTLTANLIKAGVLGDLSGRNYWNMVTGAFSLSAGATVGGSPIASDQDVSTIAGDYIHNYDKGLQQEAVFNKLTNNGTAQGIYLEEGNLYINASYIKTGTLSADLITTGSMSAARIKTGTMSANRIKGGKIVGNDSNSEWDLTTGQFKTIGSFGYTQILSHTIHFYHNEGPHSYISPNYAYFAGLISVVGNASFSSDITVSGTIHNSDRKRKNKIRDIDDDMARSFIMGLRAREFVFNDDETETLHHGFIAQEVFDAMDGEEWGVHAFTEDRNGKTSGIRYNEIIADLVAVVQAQERKIDQLEDRIIELEKRL